MENNVANERAIRKEKKAERDRARIGKVILFAIIAIIAITSLSNCTAKLSPIERADFIRAIESGDAEALESYKVNYIDEHKYLFDGPITMRLMAEQYDLDVRTLRSFYMSTGVETIQEFYNKYFKNDDGIVKFLKEHECCIVE